MHTTIEKNIVNQICNTNLPFHKLNKKKRENEVCNIERLLLFELITNSI